MSFAAAGAARPDFFVLESAAFAFFAEVDTEATVGEARLAETLALDTPPLTADFGVLAGDAFAAAGDLAEVEAGDLAKTTLDFPGVAFAATLGDFAGALPFPVTSRALRAAIASDTKQLVHWQADFNVSRR